MLRAVEVFLDGGEGEEVLRVRLARDLDLAQHVLLRRPPQHGAQQTLQGTLHAVVFIGDTVKLIFPGRN